MPLHGIAPGPADPKRAGTDTVADAGVLGPIQNPRRTHHPLKCRFTSRVVLSETS
jgi:hypothetical protein